MGEGFAPEPRPEDEGRLDHDTAEVVAYASKDERSRAAFQRQAAELKEQYREDFRAAKRDIHGDDSSKVEAARQRIKDIDDVVSGELGKLSQTYPEAIRQQVDPENINAGWFLDPTDDSGQFGRPSVERAQDHDRYAGRQEYWAQKAHEHPDAAMTAEACMKLENWILKNEANPGIRRSTVEKYKKDDRAGNFGADRAIRIFTDYFGEPRDGEEMTQEQSEWKELLNKGETTVNDIKNFLYNSILTDADSWQATIDEQIAKLAAVGGQVGEWDKRPSA